PPVRTAPWSKRRAPDRAPARAPRCRSCRAPSPTSDPCRVPVCSRLYTHETGIYDSSDRFMNVADMLAAARLIAGIPGFVWRPIDLPRARTIIENRRHRRAADFLELARRAVYGYTGSPYRALLVHAGCEHGDLAHLVEREGLDGALVALSRAGVYVTVDEFK